MNNNKNRQVTIESYDSKLIGYVLKTKAAIKMCGNENNSCQLTGEWTNNVIYHNIPRDHFLSYETDQMLTLLTSDISSTWITSNIYRPIYATL